MVLKIPGTVDRKLPRTWEATTPNGQAWGRGSVDFRPQAQEPQWQAVSLTDLPSLLLAGMLAFLGACVCSAFTTKPRGVGEASG